MAADFPATKKTFTQTVDGTTKLEATLFNQNYDETEALETLVGALGRAQSYNTSLKALLSNYRRGCSCIYKSATEIYVTAGEIYIPDASGNGALRQNTSDTTVGWGDIDTGSEAASTRYYVYALADSAATTFTCKISTSASAPSGATYYRKLGSFYNDGSSNIILIGDIGYVPTSKTRLTIAHTTVYLAPCDGFVSGFGVGSDSTALLGVVSDANSSPSTYLDETGRCADGNGPAYLSTSAFVKAGDYFKVYAFNATPTCYFVAV